MPLAAPVTIAVLLSLAMAASSAQIGAVTVARDRLPRNAACLR
jgi:hypothetical protein